MTTLNLNDISDNLYLLLFSLNKHIFNPNALTKKFNIPHSHIKVLFYLIHNGPIPISKMAKELYISKPNMTPVIDKLVEEGLVLRDYDPTDRRIILIQTTPKALEFLKEGQEYIKEVIKEKLAPLNEDDISTLSSSLDTLLTVIKKF
ncbi:MULTISPECIES: MarR family transcriptional regulator [unclassified Clostridium]|uniref:MarR family winged helix-turn-helix transcriptional regulator n=1 Tax=unclassified Clostridium TaxID=2614128 RepID=UPI001896A88A|nr:MULTISPECIES: MarR family transcriptional regulator [unclassified Clostridium]MBP3914935.1 MarR family transcriptional regulator [Clostridium sp.]MEE0933135.1 MarR family transcriptional regulator [Clostridium sp.]